MAILGQPKAECMTQQAEDEMLMAHGRCCVAHEEQEHRQTSRSSFYPSWVIRTLFVVSAFSCVHLFEDEDSPVMASSSRNTLWEIAPPPKINIHDVSEDVDDYDLSPMKIIIHKRKNADDDKHKHLPPLAPKKFTLHIKNDENRQRKPSYTRSEFSDSVDFFGCGDSSDPCIFQIANGGEESSEDVVLEIHHKKETGKTACANARKKHGASMQRLRFSGFDVDIYGSCGQSQIVELATNSRVDDTVKQTNTTTPTLALILN